MAEIKFSARAYCKMILHAAKYPHCAINGVLLAEDQKSKDDRKGKNVFICDAVPLFHICLHVTPMAEIALTQIDHMASTSGMVVAGYYQANENIRDLSYEKVGQRIADKIAENYSPACLVIIDNRRLSLNMDNVALCVSQFVDGKWKSKEKSRGFCEVQGKEKRSKTFTGKTLYVVLLIVLTFFFALDWLTKMCQSNGVVNWKTNKLS